MRICNLRRICNVSGPGPRTSPHHLVRATHRLAVVQHSTYWYFSTGTSTVLCDLSQHGLRMRHWTLARHRDSIRDRHEPRIIISTITLTLLELVLTGSGGTEYYMQRVDLPLEEESLRLCNLERINSSYNSSCLQ